MLDPVTIATARARLGNRSLVLVGLMGCGKSSVGRRLATRLELPFVDADDEIERAAAKSISEIFAEYGEASFRDGEKRVIARLLENGAQVLATGGGAFMNGETRHHIRAAGISVWLHADLQTLLKRVAKRDTRPLLRQGNPEEIMQKLIDGRYPIYAAADITVDSRDVPHDAIVNEIITALSQMPAATTDVDSSLSNNSFGTKVRVDLDKRSYDVQIGTGCLQQAGKIIASRFGRVKCGIVTDENVARYHLDMLNASLDVEGLKAETVILKPGEGTKSFSALEPLCSQLLEMGLERGDLVVPFGGGVIGDLAGFAAGILRRGVRFVQIPTSLLAQVDSSVGGKTGINTPQGKNLIGVFHQPSLVLADTQVLKTLPEREMRAGYAEIAKYGLIGDADFFSWLENNWQRIFSFEESAMVRAIETSVAAKAAIVAADELESGNRALLNLGHTFGHPLEAWTGYSDRLLHGEGVSIGMAMAYRFSESQGLVAEGTAERVARHLSSVGLPTRISDIKGQKADARELMRLMQQDKKVRDGQLTFILTRDIGQAFIARNVNPVSVQAFLESEISV